MPYNQFAPCDVLGCDQRRAKRRRWCPGHAAMVDSMKGKKCEGSARWNDRIESCGLTQGHEPPCLPQLEVLRQAMGGRSYRRPTVHD